MDAMQTTDTFSPPLYSVGAVSTAGRDQDLLTAMIMAAQSATAPFVSNTSNDIQSQVSQFASPPDPQASGSTYADSNALTQFPTYADHSDAHTQLPLPPAGAADPAAPSPFIPMDTALYNGLQGMMIHTGLNHLGPKALGLLSTVPAVMSTAKGTAASTVKTWYSAAMSNGSSLCSSARDTAVSVANSDFVAKGTGLASEYANSAWQLAKDNPEAATALGLGAAAATAYGGWRLLYASRKEKSQRGRRSTRSASGLQRSVAVRRPPARK